MIRTYCFIVLVLACSTTLFAQGPSIRALRLEADEKIAIDARLDEPAWDRAVPITDFKQSEPKNGEPPSERTEIRILFDRQKLYIGAQFYDASPDGVLGNQMVRDGGLGSDDRFIWVLDPFNDRRSGYYFEINPGGAMGDAQLVPSQAGFGVQQSRAWNGIWLARVRRHEQGWTIEVEIPFQTLNFNPASSEWGANFQRTIRRKNEEIFWSGWARNQGIYSLANAGRIVGISDVGQGHGIDVKPYLLGTYTDRTAGPRSVYKGNEGIDLFYNLTPQLKATFTLNTDFAQTEVDDRQVNLTRFPLFFPEKRDFFLESSGNFDFGREPQTDLTAFFSRRIGLTSTGQPQKIDYGAKVAGSVGRYNLGLLRVRTAEQNAIKGEDFTIFRPKAQFLRQSYAGIIYTRRETRDSTTPARQSIGADILYATNRFRGSQNVQAGGYYIKTPDGIKKGNNGAYGLRFLYPNDRWSGRLVIKGQDKDFNPAVGFAERTDFREVVYRTKFAPRPKNSKTVRQMGAEIWADLFVDTQNRWIDRDVRYIFDIALQSGDSASYTVEPIYTRLREPFRISSGITLPAGNEYNYVRHSFNFNSVDRRMVAYETTIATGTFLSGHRREISGTLGVRPRRGVLVQLTGQFNRVNLAEGHFSTKVLRSLINTQFSPFISVSNNIQYDSVSRVMGWQSRFRWIVKPGNDIYFVWMQNWFDADKGLTTLDRNAAVKLLYTYRF